VVNTLHPGSPEVLIMVCVAEHECFMLVDRGKGPDMARQ
jgi:hypothetical protein